MQSVTVFKIFFGIYDCFLENVDSGKKDYHWDMYWSELNADINSVEVEQEISTEQIWYLREKI